GTFNLTSGGGSDNYIVKLNSGGDLVWAKRVGGSGGEDIRAVAADPTGNLYTTGSFAGVVDFDPGPGIFNLAAPAGSSAVDDVFVLKLDGGGNFVWARRVGGISAGVFDQGYGLALDVAGNVY